MKKLLPLVLMFVLLFSSCLSFLDENIPATPIEGLPAPQTKEELYSLYDMVSFGQTKEELNELFGEPTPVYDQYDELIGHRYFNEIKSAGVTVVFDEADTVVAKTLFYNMKKYLVPFSGRYIEDKLFTVKTGASLKTAIEIMEGAEPLELSHRYGKDGPEDSYCIYAWYNEDASFFMIHTKQGLIDQVALYRD